MPELPEVEAARRGITEQLTGRPIQKIDLRRPGLVMDDFGLSFESLIGESIQSVDRYGKYMVILFEPFAAVVHLKLTGQFVARGQDISGFAAGHPVPAYDAELPHKSTHLIISFEGDAQLYLTDIRHFARIWLMPHDALSGYLANLKLGPDVLPGTFTPAVLRERLERRTSGKIKPILLDQAVIAGLGNIYVDESLWQARIHPERQAGSLAEEELDRLYKGIADTMEIALPLGGAKIKHSKALTELGEFPFVHAREGYPCQRCGGQILKTKVANRGTYLCPVCQPAAIV